MYCNGTCCLATVQIVRINRGKVIENKNLSKLRKSLPVEVTVATKMHQQGSRTSQEEILFLAFITTQKILSVRDGGHSDTLMIRNAQWARAIKIKNRAR